MNILLDTNVVLDVLLAREPFSKPALEVLRAVEDDKCKAFVTASSITDIFYLLKRNIKDIEKSYELLGILLSISKVLTITPEIISTAYNAHWKDFEDCVQYNAAKNSKIDYIITRNEKDFEQTEIKSLSPEAFLEVLNSAQMR